ncbi:MAG TPA: hypothetical protein VKM55_05480 [Candidatus Lokiarchaeia archaeon]|nr:hypothetical protein [Candidatus Lokiarchaeia archaeon]
MAREALFFKASGTIFDAPRDRAAFIASMKAFAGRNSDCLIYVVPGGGKKVDDLRAVYDEDPAQVTRSWFIDHGEILEPEQAAHWHAIEIMDEIGKDLSADLRSCENIIVPSVTRISMDRVNELPESWDITSDSIVYSIASAFAGETDDVPWIILLKHVDGVIDPGSNVNAIPRRQNDVSGTIVKNITVIKGKPRPLLPSYPFDVHMFVLVHRHKIPFYVVNWRHLERVDMLVRGIVDVTCTIITPGP